MELLHVLHILGSPQSSNQPWRRIEGHWGQNTKGATRFVADQIHIRQNNAEVTKLAETEVLPPVLPLLINRAITLTLHHKAIRRELMSIHRIIERHKAKNQN